MMAFPCDSWTKWSHTLVQGQPFHLGPGSHFSCLLRGETQTVSSSCPHLVQLQKLKAGTSLVVQWLKLQLPMQGAWVQSLVRELRSHMLEFSSVAQSYLTLCDPKECSMPGLPVHQQLPEVTQTHVHQVSDAIQPSLPLSSSSPPVFYFSHHQGLFQWLGFLHQMTKVLEVKLRHQSFQWILRTELL